MQKQLFVMNTDQPNRYGMVFPLQTLAALLAQAWRGGTPMFVSHDYHRPIGWSRPLGLGFQDATTWLVGEQMLASTPEDQTQVEKLAAGYLEEKIGQIPDEDNERLRARAGALLSEEAIFLRRECSCVVQDGIARRMFPQFFPERENDKRGLTPLRELRSIAPGVYEVEDGVCVFAHRFFRRSGSYLNNLNKDFIARFEAVATKSPDLSAVIALDPDSIGLATSYREPIELAYWWGPKFSDSLAEIPIGITRHSASERQRYYHRVDRTEFWWHAQNDIRSFECEEVVDGPTLGLRTEHFACRYVHSMLDPASAFPYHLDGAMRIYDEDGMISRLDVDMAEAGRRAQYVKLWRLDGELTVAQWKELISDYFRDNELVAEYLHGQAIGEQIDATDLPDPDESLARYVPNKFRDDDPPIAFISYFETIFRGTSQVEIISDDVLHHGDGSFRELDFGCLQLIKKLRYANLKVKLPAECQYVAYEDTDVRFPRIWSPDRELASVVLSVTASHLRVISQNAARVVTCCFDVALLDGTLRIGLMGSASKVSSLLEHLSSALPATILNADAFLADVLRHCGGPPRQTRPLLLHLHEDGSFNLGRKFASDAVPVGGGEGKLQFAVPRPTGELSRALTESRVTLMPAFKVRAAICSTCGDSYLVCGCAGSVTLDDFELLGAIWTQRPAWGHLMPSVE